jgi:hypothetical protein
VWLVDDGGATHPLPATPITATWTRPGAGGGMLHERVIAVSSPEGPVVVAVQDDAHDAQWYQHSTGSRPPLVRGHGAAPVVLDLGSTRVTLRSSAAGYDDEVGVGADAHRVTGGWAPVVPARAQVDLPLPLPLPEGSPNGDGFGVSADRTVRDGVQWLVAAPRQQVPTPLAAPYPGEPLDPRDDWTYENLDRLVLVRSGP